MSKEAFEALKAVLVAHSSGLRVTKDAAMHYQLHTAGPVEFEGRKLPNIYFAWLKEGKNDTALHFFPIYSHPERFDDLPPKLRKKLTGKACFHFKTADPEMLEAVAAMLDRGREIYTGAGRPESRA
jgi:hypothetical protein